MKLLKRFHFFHFILCALPLVFFAAFALPPPLGKGLFLTNDFPTCRIWWTQMDVYFISKGFFPLWNPTVEMGHPWLAMSTGAGSYYPLRWWTYLPTYFGGIANYWTQYLQICFHMTIGMWGIYKILKRFARVSEMAAVIAASSFLLNQSFNTFTRFPHGVEDICLVPWLFYFSLCLLNEDRFSWVSFLGLILAMDLSWLTGYGQFSYVGVVGVIVLCATCGRSFSKVLSVATAGFLGSILAIGAIYPAVEWVTSHPLRNGKAMEQLSLLGVTEYKNILINPFGVDVHISPFTFPFFIMFFLVGLGTFLRKGNRLQKVSLAMFVLFILLGDLSRGPLGLTYGFFYKYLPFFGAFNGPAKLIWLEFIPFSWFLAIGIDHINSADIGDRKAKKRYFALAAFCLAFVLSLFNHPHIAAGAHGIWQPLKAGWLTVSEARHEYFVLLIASTFFVFVILWLPKRHYQGAALLLLSWIFSLHFATLNTWVSQEPDPSALLGVQDSFPDGVLGPRTFLTGSISNIGMIDPIVDPPMWKLVHDSRYNLIGVKDQRFPESRFLWRPHSGSSAMTVKMNQFNPNYLNFTVDAPESGELVYLNKFSSSWRSNVDFHVAKPFEEFFAIPVHAGKQTIQMEFRPISHILTGIFTVLGFFLVLGAFLFKLGETMETGKIWWVGALLSGLTGVSLSVFIFLGSQTNRGLSELNLFGKDLKSLDTIGAIAVRSGQEQNFDQTPKELDNK